jgi:hypothetical protein
MTGLAVTSGAEEADAPYWQGLREGRLLLPRCARCARWLWPAVHRCGACGGWGQSWHAVEPVGEIYSWTRTWQPFQGNEDLRPPYVNLLVALPQAGGIRLLGLLEGDAAAPGLRVGAPVAGVFGTRSPGHALPALRWRLTEGS